MTCSSWFCDNLLVNCARLSLYTFEMIIGTILAMMKDLTAASGTLVFTSRWRGQEVTSERKFRTFNPLLLSKYGQMLTDGEFRSIHFPTPASPRVSRQCSKPTAPLGQPSPLCYTFAMMMAQWLFFVRDGGGSTLFSHPMRLTLCNKPVNVSLFT